MIPFGVPADAASWPEGLIEHLRKFEQGHLVKQLPFFYYADPNNLVFSRRDTQVPEEPLIWDEQEFPYGIIATQTCDLREENTPRPKMPWIQCCPVYQADEPGREAFPNDQIGLIKKDRIQYLLWVPQLPEDGVWVADLRLLVPIEKSWLSDRDPIDGFAAEAGRLKIGKRLALLYSRPALDGSLVESVSEPLMKELRVLARSNKDLFAEISGSVYALAVRARRLAEMDLESMELHLLCNAELSAEAADFWQQQWEQWAEIAMRSTDHRLQPLQVRLLADMRADEFVRLTVVPLAAMTPHPLWYRD